MSTTVELVRANERYARLRAAVEKLADKWECPPHYRANALAMHLENCHGCGKSADLRALLAAVDS